MFFLKIARQKICIVFNQAVIENGNIITYTPNYEKTSVDRYIIAARGKIDNADAIMGVIV